ncbi:MAG: EutG [Paenibacillus sp.]|jgi:alcohol dehydrogenase class IV|nr:EutG [Paenibacillus sp.]
MHKVYEFFTTDKIVFGIGAIGKIGDYLNEFGAKNVLVVTDKFLSENNFLQVLTDQLEKSNVEYEVFTDVLPSPTQTNAENCGETLKRGGFDAVIAFGGGSSIDVAKGGALLVSNPPPIDKYVGVNKVPNPTIPIITIPTTAGSGSEVSITTILKNNETNVKAGIVSNYILPNLALVDPTLTLSLPQRLTAATGIDALVHAIEGYSALKCTPFIDIYYEKAIGLIASNLRAAVGNGQNLATRYNMSLAATMTGIGMAIASGGAAHAMSYAVEGKYNIYHGESVSTLLPSVMKYNALAEMEKYKKIAVLMGEKVEGLSLRDAALKSVDAVSALLKDINIPSLREIGMTEDDVDHFAEIAFATKRLMDNNAWSASLEDIKKMYLDALQ